MKPQTSRLFARLTLAFLLIAFSSAAAAAEFERAYTFDSKELKVSSMIGQVQVIQAQGDEFQVTAHVRGADAEEGLLDFQITEGSHGKLIIVFPIQEHQKYVYPELGAGKKTTFTYRNEGEQGGSWLRRMFSGISGKKITVRGKGNGVEMWVDLTIAVPRGRVLEARQGVGGIEATGLKADLNLDTGSGAIVARDIEGDFLADTGSGSVTVQGIRGDVNIDTGSGDVDLRDSEGRTILVDTGSGSVTATGIRCDDLNIDTGSGEVTARVVEADKATIDTGSGGVLLQLDRMGSGKFLIDTGSGDITLGLPTGASANISAETGSGSLSTEVQGAMVKSRDKHEIELTVGDGEARVILDAGSGSITIK
jgi:hypothetical protein